jgi:hypothetical protein
LNGVPRVHYSKCFAVLGNDPDRRYAYAFIRTVLRLAKSRLEPVSTKSSSDKDLLMLNAISETTLGLLPRYPLFEL